MYKTIKGIGIVGTGNMGSALTQIFAKHHPDIPLYLADYFNEKAIQLAEQTNVNACRMEDLDKEMFPHVNLIFIAVKPKDLPDLFKKLAICKNIDSETRWVSLAVGVSLEQLHSYFPAGQQFIRIMPNTPVAIGQGYVSTCFDNEISEEVQEEFIQFMQVTGQVVQLDENLFDVASAVAGSGPAFIFQLIEAMSDAAVYYGIPRSQALQMSATTVAGAAKMVSETNQHPAQLKDAVTSPSGTTIAGIRTLEAGAFRSSIIEAIAATVEKAKE
ncbi:pyrroline-5-carboxylate reductase [Facklamia sp. DSM 111018]|uniref:Pyrroline-5-carboxylate reductase n=1 Tax=Facklamia lactis TaxID=2749967 RepID=A0ABS0LMR4_9LACT|nr:pyrroline-5-carboxylate reductase [Facklamia lactis]MBG9979991.1 pyrroline-5-carboxylate reductase [Facklamia lactis]MBG9985329.1 pyrroline-5-carboxylate reductase [Facklamia lactis]